MEAMIWQKKAEHQLIYTDSSRSRARINSKTTLQQRITGEARWVNKRKRLNVDATGIDNITNRTDKWVLKIKTDTTQRTILVSNKDDTARDPGRSRN